MITLRLITTAYDRSVANKIILDNHSYVPTIHTVGRHIDYLIYYDSKLIGMIGIGSATYPPCKDVLNYLNMSIEEYRNNFNSICNNWKFCLTCSIKNAGTQVLKLLRNTAPQDWYNKYGDELRYIVTFVGSNHNGAVYLADNWKNIGYTAGLPTHESVSMKWMDSNEIGCKFVKPTGENKKIIFITDRVGKISKSSRRSLI